MKRLYSRHHIKTVAAAWRALLLLGLCFSFGVRPVLPHYNAAQQTRRSRPGKAIKAGVKRSGATQTRGSGRKGNRRSQFQQAERDDTFEQPEARLEWFLFQRTYPEPSPTLPAFTRSNTLMSLKLREIFRLNTIVPFDFQEPRWNSLGPLPIRSFVSSISPTTGRLGAVAVSPADPNLVLAGGAVGGIWLSVNGGERFTAVADNQNDMAVETFAFARSNPSIVYAGMGDITGGYMGNGVLKSYDGGQNWEKAGQQSLPIGAVTHIIVDPTDPRRVYITEFKHPDPSFPSASRDGFRFSTDGGDTWSDLKKVGMPRDLVMHPSNPKVLYLSMTKSSAPDPPAAVYKSTDGGESWSRIFTPAFVKTTDLQLAVTPAEPETIYLLSGGVFNPMSGCGIFERTDVNLLVSKDGGQTWKDLGAPRNVDAGSFGRKTYIAVDPKDARLIYIGTHDLFRSSDGGITWRNLTNNYRSNTNGDFEFDPKGEKLEPKGIGAVAHGDQHVFAFSPVDSKIIYIGHDGGLSRSKDRGDTFESLNNSLPLAQLNNITAHPTDPGILYAGTQDNGALVRKSSGTEWREFVAGDSGGCVIDPGDSSIVIANYVLGTLNRFSKNGEQQETKPIATNATFLEDNPCPRIGFYPPFISDLSTGKLYFGTWQLFVSSDLGNSWLPTAKDTDLTKGTAGIKPDVLTAIAVSKSQSDVIYTGSSQGQVMLSRDGGKSWKSITNGLVDRFIKSIVVDPTDPNTAYLTFSGFKAGHVFKTTNAGTSWADISGNLDDTPVNALLIDPADPNIIYIGTDVGVFRSTVSGQVWEYFNAGLPPVAVTGFSVRSDKTIQLATFGRGAYELVR